MIETVWRIKPLEWDEYRDGSWSAEGGRGWSFDISPAERRSGGFEILLQYPDAGHVLLDGIAHETAEEAKEACEEWHLKTVKSLLEEAALFNNPNKK